MPATISVVSPSLNQVAYVERAINSVLGQDVQSLEYLVVDGGSTDGTLSVLARYEPRLRWVSEPDRGQAHAVNKGFQATAGEVIGWLNSDDIYYPGAIRAAIEVFQANPDVDVVYGMARHIDEEGDTIGLYPTEAWDLERLRAFCYICQPAVFFRRRVIEHYGVLDERLHHCLDYEYWLRLGLRGAKFYYLERLQAGSRWHAETKSVRSRLRAYRETNDMLRTTLGRVPDSWIFNYAHIVVEEQRIPRAHPLRFAMAIVAVSCYAAFRWNHGLSPSLVKTIVRWAGRHAPARLRRESSR